MITLALQLFFTFFVIGCLTIGGGNVMIPLIQHQVVVQHGWITEEAFTNIIAVSQMTPGPIGINCATYVGYEVLGVGGSLLATMALVLPSFFIVLAIVKVYEKLSGNYLFKGMMTGLKPAVAGLLGAAALVLIFSVQWSGGVPQVGIIEQNFPHWSCWVLFAAALVATFCFKVGPIALLAAAGVIGLIIY